MMTERRWKRCIQIAFGLLRRSAKYEDRIRKVTGYVSASSRRQCQWSDACVMTGAHGW